MPPLRSSAFPGHQRNTEALLVTLLARTLFSVFLTDLNNHLHLFVPYVQYMKVLNDMSATNWTLLSVNICLIFMCVMCLAFCKEELDTKFYWCTKILTLRKRCKCNIQSCARVGSITMWGYTESQTLSTSGWVLAKNKACICEY